MISILYQRLPSSVIFDQSQKQSTYQLHTVVTTLSDLMTQSPNTKVSLQNIRL